jgi:hypothetical protein
MRAVELAHGSYPADGVEAERMLLLRMQDSLSGSVSPTDPWREGGSTPEEAAGLFSGYGEDHVQAVRSLVFALYSAAGGDEWALDIKLNNDASPLARVRGNSLESSRRQVDISVDVRSLACETRTTFAPCTSAALGSCPGGRSTVEEAANEALEAVEEMQGALERVHEISNALDTQRDMRNARMALDNLWMGQAGIAAAEEDLRSRGTTNRQI